LGTGHSAARAAVVPVIGAAPGTVVELVPGKKYLPLPASAAPVVALCELVPAGGGTFRPVARICPQWFPATAEVIKQLGLGVSKSSLRRLIAAGFVRGQQSTPATYQFDYLSFREHAERCQDPEFWEQVAPGQRHTNRQRYLAILEHR
jgi:hypothetical protein